MGLTGGVKSHRLSGQISPYCEKKRLWLCAYCAPMFSCRNYRVKTTITYLPICLQRLPVESGGVILTRYPGQGGFSSFIIN